LYFVLQEGFRREAEANMTGTAGHMRVPSEFLENVEVPLPPLLEQERIITTIEELFSKLDSGISELEEATQRLEKYRKAILEKAIWGELTEKWRQQHTEVTNPRELLIDSSEYSPPDGSDMPEVPDEWILATFGDVFEVYLGSTPKRSNDKYWNGDINWISSGEVEFSKIKDSDENITRAGLESCSTTVHPPNTVILGIIGQGKTRGRAAILDIEAAHNQNTVAIHPEEVGIPAEFIYYFFMENYERTRRLGSGNQQKALSKTRVQNMVFPLPSVEEQRQISKLLEQGLSTLEKVEQSVEANIKRSNRLRQSIFKQAFEGKLVPQKPTEEPPTSDGGDTNLEPGEQVTLSEVTTDVE
jgi:type I restriction enzyme S subunit